MGKRIHKVAPCWDFSCAVVDGERQEVYRVKLDIKGLYPGSTRVKSWVWGYRIEAIQVVGLGGKGQCQRSRLEVETHCMGWRASSIQGQGRRGYRSALGIKGKFGLLLLTALHTRGTLESED